MRSPSSAPPVKGLVGSTARMPTVSPRCRQRRARRSTRVLLPAPGGPVTPTTRARPVRGKMRPISSRTPGAAAPAAAGAAAAGAGALPARGGGGRGGGGPRGRAAAVGGGRGLGGGGPAPPVLERGEGAPERPRLPLEQAR